MKTWKVLIGAAALFVTALIPGAVWAGEPGALDLGKWENKVVLLDFWASWCDPCAESFPWMTEMSRKYGDQGFVVVAVNLDAERSNADRFLAEHPSVFEHVFDPEGVIAEAYGVETMPTSIVIDRSGKPVARHQGFRSKNAAEYEHNLVAALNGETDFGAVHAELPFGGSQGGVRPWEKGVLALPTMAFTLDLLDLEIDDHIYFSKEASSGGRGFGGGGCGCN